jgi:beta-galactosidase
MGAAWYRNGFVTDGRWGDERVFLDFEGLMSIGDVWVNGKKVASTEYGYLGFEVDVTNCLNPVGVTNTVEVWTSTGHMYGSRWYTGGGLYRPVRIKTRPARSIARHGIFVTAPFVSATSAAVRVQLELDGFRLKPDMFKAGKVSDADAASLTGRVDAVAVVADPAGRNVAEVRCAVPMLDYRGRTEFVMPDVSIPDPLLWDICSPKLYSVNVRLEKNGTVIDSDVARFGIRNIEFSPRFGFRLNGRKVFLKSMSNHSDYGAVGTAQFDRAIERELRQMKSFGFNAVRCSHNPYAEAFYRLADELGLLVVDEFVDKWPSDNSFWCGRKPFLAIWPELMTEWIRRSRNHPSVILWSLGNELQQSERYSGYDTGDWGVTTYRIMDVFAKRLDPTRLTTVGLFPARAGSVCLRDPRFNVKPLRPPELAEVMDVASFNYRYEDYPDYLRWNPDIILFQSEASTSRWLEPYLKMDRERTVGVSWWGAVEYWGESNRWPKKGWNYSFFSHTLEPRPQAYLIKSGILPDEPLTRVCVVADSGERLVWNDIHSGQYLLEENWNPDGKKQRDVFVFSNSGSVELLLNGKSLGSKKTVSNVALWKDVGYSPGRLEARGDNGTVHAIETTGVAVGLELVEEMPGEWRRDGVDLKYVRMYAIDAKGRRVPDACNMLNVTVEGPAELYALDNGDHFTDELFNVASKAMKGGFMLAILKSKTGTGKVTLKITGTGIAPASMVLSR